MQSPAPSALLVRLQSIEGKLDRLASQPRASAFGAALATAEAPAPASASAMSAALSRLREAVRNGRWTAEDVAATRSLVSQMTGEQAEEFLRSYSQHVNAGELRSEVQGPPF
jgi:hypothetical protein